MGDLKLRSSDIKNFILSFDRKCKMRTVEVCAVNELPFLLSKRIIPSVFVVNTDPNFRAGSHWVVIHIPNNTVANFFDPLGFPPSFYNYRILKFLTSNEDSSFKYFYSNTAHQPDNSSACGFYCCLYVKLVLMGMRSLKDISDTFSSLSETEVVERVVTQQPVASRE